MPKVRSEAGRTAEPGEPPVCTTMIWGSTQVSRHSASPGQYSPPVHAKAKGGSPRPALQRWQRLKGEWVQGEIPTSVFPPWGRQPVLICAPCRLPRSTCCLGQQPPCVEPKSIFL